MADDTRWSEHTQIERYDGGFRIGTFAGPYANGWGVGLTFPSERGAQMVATAIELALKDTDQ